MQEYHCCAVQIKKQNKNNGNVIVLFKSQSYEKEVHTVIGQQFHQYQQKEQSPLTLNHRTQKRP